MSNYIDQELASIRQKLETIELKIGVGSDQCGCNKNVVLTHTGSSIGGISGQTVWASKSSDTITGRASIDSTNDNFLNCVRGVWGNDHNYVVFSHSNTATAFSNIRGGAQDFSLICGHGAPGLIVTGSGQIVDGTDKYMSSANESSWRPIASQGITGGQLTLFGCQVAAGTQGADFLRRVAGAVRQPVGAWTGDVFCGSGKCWGTGTFLVIQPGTTFEPVEAPDMFDERNRRSVLRLASYDNYEEIRYDQIKYINHTPIGSLSEGQETLVIERTDSIRILDMIDFDNPLITDDKPGAILTGLFTIIYETPTGDKVRSFRVLRYSLLQDVLFPSYYYYASNDFNQALLKR